MSDSGVESAVYSDNTFTDCIANESGVVSTLFGNIKTRYVMGLAHPFGPSERESAVVQA